MDRNGIREMKTRNGRRWQRDDQGKYHYRGRCPFNNAVCKLLNRFAGTDNRSFD